jgi:phosphatidylethanolamine-binding protein (PEBP) family uncharacterized protein
MGEPMSIKRKLLTLILILATLVPISAQAKSDDRYPEFVNMAILQLLADANVFNYGLINSFEPISDLKLMRVTYAPGAFTDLGNGIDNAIVQNPPISITFPKPKKSGLYTLFMIDPDALARDDVIEGYKFTNYFHWGIVNIPVEGSSHHACELVDLPFNLGDVVAQYYPPTIPQDTGDHRYTFLLYRQSGPIDATNIPVFPNPTCNGEERTAFFIDSYLTRFAHGIKMTLEAMNYFLDNNILYNPNPCGG